MPSYLSDPSAKLLKSYPPPYRGTWYTLPSHLLPDDVLAESRNVTLRKGILRSRSGLSQFDAFVFPERVTGAYTFVDSSDNKLFIAGTEQHLYRFSGSWADITGTTLTGDSTTLSRMTSIQQGTLNYLLYCNGKDTLKVSANGASLTDITPFIDPVTGPSSIPSPIDITTSFSRIVAITRPYTLAWSDVVNDDHLCFTNWPALNQAILSDTPDTLVAIRPLSTVAFAIYKEGSIFVGIAQAGPSSAAFRVEFRGKYQGPAGTQAIAEWDGKHVYMTPTGRVGVFDGTAHDWICDGVWPFLRENIDIAHSNRIFAVYDYSVSEITFWYPKPGDDGALRGMLVICLPYPLAGVSSYSYFLGESLFPCSTGLSVEPFLGQTDPLVFSALAPRKSYGINNLAYGDGGQPFQCSFNTGLFRPSFKKSALEEATTGQQVKPSLEFYTTRDGTRGIAHVSSLVSQQLETSGEIGDLEELDLTQIQPNEFVASGNIGSFLGVRAEWFSDAKVEYKGCDVWGREVG